MAQIERISNDHVIAIIIAMDDDCGTDKVMLVLLDT